MRARAHSFVRSLARAILLESGGIRAYAVTFDRETFDDARPSASLNILLILKNRARRYMLTVPPMSLLRIVIDHEGLARRSLENFRILRAGLFSPINISNGNGHCEIYLSDNR